MAELFLDCDGVLADFDSGAKEVLGGLSPRQFEARHSKGEFWKRLARAKDFYATLPLLPEEVGKPPPHSTFALTAHARASSAIDPSAPRGRLASSRDLSSSRASSARFAT